MRLTANELAREAASTGFQAEPLEKVILLLELLEAIRSHPFLKERVALKGGTALNLFRSDVPRLSVDIDLNYIGAVDRDGMLADRPRIEQALHAVCGRVGVQPRRVPSDHAGGRWRLNFNRVAGGTGTFEVDVNFLLRTPLWPVERIDSRAVGTFQATDIPVLDVHELAAGKLAALLSRTASRDLFDASQLLRGGGLDSAKLRLAFIVYGGTSRKDWRTVSVDDVTVDAAEADATLLPLLRGNETPRRSDLAHWARTLAADCHGLLSMVLPLADHEREFLERLNGKGEILAEALTDDHRLRDIIRTHPGLLWKALNVQKYRGTATHRTPPETDLV
jgi:predicted nucleotidyltransferase component of viral defense system